MDVDLFVTAGLGDASYLLSSEGEAVVVDPQRDVWRFLAGAERRGVRVRFVAETHVHNDYVTGAHELRAAAGAELALPATGGYEFPFRAMAEGEELRVGALRLVAMDTPGHTPEHVSYLVYEDGEPEPAAVLTGGSLIVGSAGRTDLLGEGRTGELTRAQFHSMRRFLALPDAVRVLPTHGAGSFCASTPPADSRTSTVRDERQGNGALRAADEAAFAGRQLTGLPAYPRYYAHMAAINRRGPRVLGRLSSPPALSPAEAARAADEGAWVVDARGREAFAEGHVRGSVNVELDDAFGSYVGWVVPFDAPIVLVVPEPAELAVAEAAVQLARIGYERVVGYAEGGVEAWGASGRPVDALHPVEAEEVARASLGGGAVVLDVRQAAEWAEGVLDGSLQIFVGDLPDRMEEVPVGPEVLVACASGFRATIAASLVARRGVRARPLLSGGVPDVLAARDDLLGSEPALSPGA